MSVEKLWDTPVGIGLPYDHPIWRPYVHPRFRKNHPAWQDYDMDDPVDHCWDYGEFSNKPEEKPMNLSEYHRSVQYLRVGEEKPLPGKPLYNPDYCGHVDRKYHAKWTNTVVGDDGVYRPINPDNPSLEGSREKEREAKLEKKRQLENTVPVWNGESEWMPTTPVEEDSSTGSSALDWAKEYLKQRSK